MIWDWPNHQNFLKFQSDSGMTLELKPLEIEGSLSWMVDPMPTTGSSPSTQMHALISYTFSLFQVLSRSPSRVNIFETTWITTLSSPHSLICALQSELCFFFWPPHTACRTFIPRAGIEPLRSAAGAQSRKHWTTREVPEFCSRHHAKRSDRCCQIQLLLLCPHHPLSLFLSLLNKYIFLNFVMLHALVFPPPE